MTDVSYMSIGRNKADGKGDTKKAYAANVQVKAHSSTSCSFCWFVMTIYPTLNGMIERDSDTFRLHLQKAHGLGADIQP
jgi:hypothetical protein